MRKLLLGLLVVATALGASAFKNAPKKVQDPTIFYVLTSNNEYQLFNGTGAPSETECEDEAPDACVIGYELANDPGLVTLTPGPSLPSPDYTSSLKGTRINP